MYLCWAEFENVHLLSKPVWMRECREDERQVQWKSNFLSGNIEDRHFPGFSNPFLMCSSRKSVCSLGSREHFVGCMHNAKPFLKGSRSAFPRAFPCVAANKFSKGSGLWNWCHYIDTVGPLISPSRVWKGLWIHTIRNLPQDELNGIILVAWFLFFKKLFEQLWQNKYYYFSITV